MERGPIDAELEARLGEPLETYGFAMPVGGWTPSAFGSLVRAFKQRGSGAIKLGQFNVVALTRTRVVCFAAAFERKRGLWPGDQLADWPRPDVEGSATREESTTATMYADGDVGANNTAKLVRLTLRAGTQELQADFSDDERTAALLAALAVEPV